VTLTPRESTFVAPFYLHVMGLNAIRVEQDTWGELVRVGRTADVDDVSWLLQTSHWRPVVIGAWLSLRLNSHDISKLVLESLLASMGSLTAPALATVAVVHAGHGAVPALRDSNARGDGASRVVLDSALMHLGEQPDAPVASADRARFGLLLAFAQRLRRELSED